MSDTNDPYRTPVAPVSDDRQAIAELFDRLRARVLLVSGIVVLVMALGSLALAWVSRGRFLCLCLPIVPFLGVGAGWLARLGLVLPGGHVFRAIPGPEAFDLEVDGIRARVDWDEVAEAVHREAAHDVLPLFGILGSVAIRLRSGEIIGMPIPAEGSYELVAQLRRRGLLRVE
jgi:hypothetical protein